MHVILHIRPTKIRGLKIIIKTNFRFRRSSTRVSLIIILPSTIKALKIFSNSLIHSLDHFISHFSYYLSKTCTCSIHIIMIRTITSIMIRRLTIITQNRRHIRVRLVVINVPTVILVVRITMKNILAMSRASKGLFSLFKLISVPS